MLLITAILAGVIASVVFVWVFAFLIWLAFSEFDATNPWN